MSRKLIDRRSFLLSGVALGSGFALLDRTGPARAFSVETIPEASGLGIAYANRCSSDAQHAQILAKLDAELAGKTGEKGTYLTATEVCPICGCPIIATRYIR